MSRHAVLRCGQRQRGEDGYVLATAVALMFITILTVMSVVTVQLSNIAGTRRAAGQLEGRFGGEQALDQSFTQVLAAANASPDITDFAEIMNRRSPAIVVSTSDSVTWVWYKADLSGVCTDASATCVHISASGGATSDFVVEVTTRARCSGGYIVPTPPNGQYSDGSCVVTKYQQRIRKKQFFDYLSMTDLEQLSSAWNPPGARVAYVGGDKIRGPIRSNDQFSICAPPPPGVGPEFSQAPESASMSGPAFLAPTNCTINATIGGMPADSGTPVRAMKRPSSTSDFVAIAGASQVISSCLVGRTVGTVPNCGAVQPAEIVLSVDLEGRGGFAVRPSVAGASLGSFNPLPASGVLVVRGDVRVRGTLKGRLTIATVNAGDILPNGDLTYDCIGGLTLEGRTTFRNLVTNDGGLPLCSGDSLGLIAARNISVLCAETVTTPPGLQENYETERKNDPATGQPLASTRCAPSTTDETNRYAVGAWLAVGECGGGDCAGTGTIATQRWATAGTGTAPSVPVLYFYGSMTSKYRAVFGLTVLGQGSQGTTVRGLSKQFRHDATLKNRQPPYFLEPTTDLWERVDLVEVAPCGAGLFGQRPQGAGC